MKFSASVALTVLASIASASVASSKPFYLVLESSNSNLDGTALEACHEGAAIEALCKGKPISASNAAFTTYNFKQASPNYGEITWLEDASTGYVQSLGFLKYTKGSNVLFPLFGDGKVQDFSFDSQGRLYIDPNEAAGKAEYNWYMCKQTFESYTYNVLSWVTGTGEPDNNTCQKVNVKRVYQS